MWILICECSLSFGHFSFMVSELSCFLSCSCGNSLLVSKLMSFLSGFDGKSLLFSHIGKLFNVGFLCSLKFLLMSFSFCFSLFHSFFSSLSSSGCLFLGDLDFFLGSFLSGNSFLFSFLSHLFSKLICSFSFFEVSLFIGDLLSLFLSLSDKFLSSFSSLFSFFNIFLGFS